MSKSVTEFIVHIHKEAEYIYLTSRNKKYADLINDPTWQRAVVRSLEIIGEASKKVDEDFRMLYPGIQWRSMAKMRDKLIHDYFGVDYEIVWDVIENKIPELYSATAALIERPGQ